MKAGLQDVVAGESSICYIDGDQGRLIYQGYNIHDLAEHSTFEETAFLLWHGRLPNEQELRDLERKLVSRRALPEPVLDLIVKAPKSAMPMEILRTAVSMLSFYDESTDDLERAISLTAKFPTLTATIGRVKEGKEPMKAPADGNTAEAFLSMLFGERPEPRVARLFDVCLVLHADHELNASTFAARVTAGTLSDMYSAITSAIGALKGPLHGGANEQVMRMLLAIGSVDKAEAWIKNALAEKQKIMGFGHRVYHTEDPRATHLRKFSLEMGERSGNTKWYEMSRVVEGVVKEEKGLYPNVDFYSASTYYALGIPIELFTPVFALSRVTGWTAHVLEQLTNNRLIRPRSEYIGQTDLTYVPLSER